MGYLGSILSQYDEMLEYESKYRLAYILRTCAEHDLRLKLKGLSTIEGEAYKISDNSLLFDYLFQGTQADRKALTESFSEANSRINELVLDVKPVSGDDISTPAGKGSITYITPTPMGKELMARIAAANPKDNNYLEKIDPDLAEMLYCSEYDSKCF